VKGGEDGAGEDVSPRNQPHKPLHIPDVCFYEIQSFALAHRHLPPAVPKRPKVPYENILAHFRCFINIFSASTGAVYEPMIVEYIESHAAQGITRGLRRSF